MSARAKKRGRSMAFTAGSPLVGRHGKRAGKSTGPAASPGLPGSKGVAALALATDDSSIVLDRLGKEIVALLKEGGAKKDSVRRRLRLGINEVTKFLEATAAAAVSCSRDPASPSSTTHTTSQSSCLAPGNGDRAKTVCRGDTERTGEGKGDGKGDGEGPLLPLPPSPTPPGIVLVCRDVRPSRLVTHIHTLVALTATPYLVLSGSSSSLGRVFGCKTMAAMAICPARSPPPPPPPPPPAALSRSPPSPAGGRGHGKTTRAKVEAGDGGGGVAGGGGVTGGGGTETEDGASGMQGKNGVRDGVGDAAIEEEEGGRQGAGARDDDRGTEHVGGDRGRKREEVREENPGGIDSAGVRAEGTGVSEEWARADEDVDSFVEFLRRKVEVPVSR